VGLLKQKARKAQARINKIRDRAGHSYDNGLGDEGWNDLCELEGTKATYLDSARELEKRLLKIGAKYTK
jgi:hypothetical protein